MSTSVIIPTADRSKLLDRAIRSVLASSELPNEIIIIDDGIEKIANTYFHSLQNFNPHIRIHSIATKGKQGPSFSRNTGVNAAQSEIIIFLDDDDEIIENYIERINIITKKYVELNFGFSNYFIKNNGNSEMQLKKANQISGYLPNKLNKSISGLGCGFWIKRNVYTNIGGLDQAIRTGEDIDLCIRLYAYKYKGWYESDPGVIVHRQHTKDQGIQNTTTTTNALAKAEYGLLTYKKNSVLFPAVSVERWFLMERYVRRTVKSGLSKKAFYDLLKLMPDPTAILGILYWCIKVASGKRYKLPI